MSKASDVKAAFGDGTNNTDSLFFTLAATSKVVALPNGWKGQYVRITPIGADMYYFFSTSASAAVVIPAAADAGAPAATTGEYVAAGNTLPVQVPYSIDGTSIYFARIGSGTGSISVTKASGKPGNNTEQGE